jgi:hypothetical protein
MKLKLWWKWRKQPQRGPAPLSFVTLVAYDYQYLRPVIRSYYPIAQEIILGLDKDRISYTKKPFVFDEGEFRRMVQEMDPEGKIRVIEGDFHSQPDPMANETHERNELSLACRKGNWIIQIDADEILLNAQEFKDWIDAGRGAGMVLVHWELVFKKIGDELLVVDKPEHLHPAGTRLVNGYIGARHTGQNKTISPLRLLHFAYGRTAEELKVKLDNWSHSKDFDTGKYFEFWKGVTLDNYSQVRDFHPMGGSAWPRLKKIKDPGLH